MAKTSGSSPAVRREFLANISAWVMQELEHVREIDEIAADVRMNRHQLTALVMMSGLIGLNAPRSLLRCSGVAQR